MLTNMASIFFCFTFNKAAIYSPNVKKGVVLFLKLGHCVFIYNGNNLKNCEK